MYPQSNGGGTFNLLATFNQAQNRVLSSAGLAPATTIATPIPPSITAPFIPNLNATTSSYASSYGPSLTSAYGSSVSAPSYQAPRAPPPLTPAYASVLTSNAAAKTKSQPRPTNNTTIQPKSTIQPQQQPSYSLQPTAQVPVAAAAANANLDYAAAILGASAAPSSMTTSASSSSTSAIRTATPNTYTAASTIASSSLSSPSYSLTSTASKTPLPFLPPSNASTTGPTTTMVKSTTSANVSIMKAPEPTYDSLKCEECGPGAEVIIDPHQGVEVCTSCGLVLGTYISDESEWRDFSDRRGDDPNRVGGPEIGLLADAGLATLMGNDPNGLGSNLAKLQNKNALSANYRHLLDAFRKSSRLSSLLSLPQSITDRANELYKKVIDSKAMRPRGADTLIVTCLYMVCKSEFVPRTLKEMAGVSEVSEKDIGRTFKEIKRMGFHKLLKPSTRGRQTSGGSDDETDEYHSYVARWGNQIRLRPPLIEAAKFIASRARDLLQKARDPSSICGAALYIASQFGSLEDRKLLTTIAAISGMSENTLRDVMQSIVANATSIYPPAFITAQVEIPAASK